MPAWARQPAPISTGRGGGGNIGSAVAGCCASGYAACVASAVPVVPTPAPVGVVSANVVTSAALARGVDVAASAAIGSGVDRANGVGAAAVGCWASTSALVAAGTVVGTRVLTAVGEGKTVPSRA